MPVTFTLDLTMCRYAFQTYKSHFACFACRKSFKKTALVDYVDHVGLNSAYEKILAVYQTPLKRREVEAKLGISYEEIQERYLADVSVCPHCGGRMASMGMDFRPPSRSDPEAWSVIQVLYENGFAFKGCGCSVGYAPPRHSADLPEWLRQHATQSQGEKLLEKIARREA